MHFCLAEKYGFSHVIRVQSCKTSAKFLQIARAHFQNLCCLSVMFFYMYIIIK